MERLSKQIKDSCNTEELETIKQNKISSTQSFQNLISYKNRKNEGHNF